MTTEEILVAIPKLSALVVGDVCLDRWCRYEPCYSEPSRETGIPRVAVVEYERTPGAAGTVASNLAALGVGRVAVLGVAGADGHGHELELALAKRGIDGSGLVRDETGLTFTYTKLINRATGVEDLPRVDYLSARDLPAEVEAQVVQRFERLAPQFDVVLVSDQMELATGGVVTARLRRAIAEFAAAHPAKPVLVDSRARGELFRNVLVKLNEDEAAQACSRIGAPADDYEALRRHIGNAALMVTRGSEGVSIITAQGTVQVATRPVAEPVDICGAGDSFHAGAALVLRLTGDAVAAARFGNLVASITIMQPGTGAATRAQVLALCQREVRS
jgi:rfaE bifunctional protein kinase chain/domain